MRKDETPNAQFSDEGIGIMLYQADGNIRALADIEADVIRLAIGHYRGRMTEVARRLGIGRSTLRSEEHTSELQSLMRISYAVFCLKKKKRRKDQHQHTSCKQEKYPV